MGVVDCSREKGRRESELDYTVSGDDPDPRVHPSIRWGDARGGARGDSGVLGSAANEDSKDLSNERDPGSGRSGRLLRDPGIASFAMYAMGLFGDGDRKSVEPIAARACGAP